MHRLRPLLTLALLLSLLAPGAAAVASELAPLLDHDHHHGGHGHGDPHHDHSAPAEPADDFAATAFHGHHHPPEEPEHEHPALRTRALAPTDLRPAERVTPQPAGPWTVAPIPGRTPSATAPVHEPPTSPHPFGRTATGAGPPDTLLSAHCSLLL